MKKIVPKKQFHKIISRYGFNKRSNQNLYKLKKIKL